MSQGSGPRIRIGVSALPIGAVLVALVAGCVGPRMIPRPGTLPPARGLSPARGLKVADLQVSCRARDRNQRCAPPREMVALTSELGDQLERALAGSRAAPPLQLRLAVDTSLTSRRTYFFDVLAALSAGHFPLVPEWGLIRLQATLVLSGPSGPTPASGPAAPTGELEELKEQPLATIRLEVKVPYQSLWYSWYRRDQEGRAFEDGWKILADQMLARLRVHLAGQASSGRPVASFRQLWAEGGDQLEGETQVRTDESGGLVETTSIALDRDDRWRLLRKPRLQKTTARGLLHKYLSAFSGLEAGYFMGAAWVDSEARDSSGATYTVASGRASSRGYRISFYTIPEKSDWFIFPTLGFFSLDIDIQDFRQNIPLYTVEGATTIPGVGSDPATGLPLDLGDPNVYRLELRSAYLGQRISGTLVYGTPTIHLFGTLEGGINFIEVRHNRVYLGKYTTAGYSAALVRSGALRGILGFAIRPWHVAFRIEANYEAYWKFSFPEELEFMGRMELNPFKQVYERRRTFVGAASSGVGNVFFGANFYY